MRKIGSRFAISASFLTFAIALAAPAMAQDSAAADDSEEAPAQELVVTGSLIQRPNQTSVSPITTVSAATLQETGQANVVDSLNQLPGFTVGGNSSTGGQGSGARATINLHGLGTNRNLVLLDGRRLPVSDIRGNVDINILPDAIIGGVDAITGGASAVYGSDAMSGVVNFKSIRSLDGVVMDAQVGMSELGDAFRFKSSVAFGSSFADDRGHVVAAFSYAEQDPLNGSKRPFFFDKTPSGFIGSGVYVPSAANAPSGAVLTTLFNGYGIAGTRNPLGSNLGFNNNGTLFTQTGALNYQGPNGTGGYAIVGGNVRMPVGQQIDYVNGLNRKTAFVKADYDLTPDMTLFGQFMFVDLTTSTSSGGSLTQFATLTTIPVTNPFIPADLATVLASRTNPTANFNWSSRYVGVPYKAWDENYLIQQYMTGVKGKITDGWSFDVFVSYDQSVRTSTMHHAVLKSRVQTLLNAPDGGASICAGGFNPFGDANARGLSAACQAYITKDAISTERLGQTQVQGQVNGTLFDLGAGPVQLAVLAGYRRNTYSYAPDSDAMPTSGFAPGANIEGYVAQLPVSKKVVSVREAAAQIDIPLISDKPMFKELAVGGAIRVSDYDPSGSVVSYEGDLRWRPVDALLLRGSYQRAVRAPNIAELYSPAQGAQLAIGDPSTGALGDPCDSRSSARTGANGANVTALCVAQGIPSISTYQFPTTATGMTSAGNPGVTPERANTFNVGFVFAPQRGSGLFGDFSFSVDYYNIKIKNVISTVPGLVVLSKCYNLDGSNPSYSNSNEYCQLIQRDTISGQLVTVNAPFLNLGAVNTDGIEIQVHWGIRAPFLADSGKLYVDSSIGWLNNYSVQLLPGGSFLNYTNVSNGSAGEGSLPPRATPRWKAVTTFGYKSDDFNIGLRWRYQNPLQDVSLVTNSASTALPVPAYATWDMFSSFNVGNKFELRMGVNNLFNRGLPFVASNQTGTDVAQYDLIGRSFYLGFKARF